MRKTLLASVAALLAALPSTVLAQDTGIRVPVEHKQVIATNPIGDVLGWFNVEYNRKISETATFELSASTFEFFGEGDRVSRVSAGARFYPQAAALTGVFFGAKLGVFRYSEDDVFGERGSAQRNADFDDSGTAYLFAAEVGYEWLMGRKRNVHIGIGAGGTRLFGGDVEDNIGAAYPTMRLKIGFAF